MSFKFNPITGKLDLVNSLSALSQDQFSYLVVDAAETVEIPEGQQMVVNGHVRVLGHLLVSGELVDISARKPEAFMYDVVEEDEVVVVRNNRLLLYKDHMTISGHLRVLGRLGAA
jgi:hypothetical protein